MPTQPGEYDHMNTESKWLKRYLIVFGLPLFFYPWGLRQFMHYFG